MDAVQYDESAYTYLIEGLSVDTSGLWEQWEWSKTSPWTSYDCARLEEYRDSVIIAYRLYNRIGLEHARQVRRLWRSSLNTTITSILRIPEMNVAWRILSWRWRISRA